MSNFTHLEVYKKTNLMLDIVNLKKQPYHPTSKHHSYEAVPTSFTNFTMNDERERFGKGSNSRVQNIVP